MNKLYKILSTPTYCNVMQGSVHVAMNRIYYVMVILLMLHEQH